MPGPRTRARAGQPRFTLTLSGRGIGLSALRHGCVASGGHIAVTSRPGAGTTFELRWPSAARADVLQRTAV